MCLLLHIEHKHPATASHQESLSRPWEVPKGRGRLLAKEVARPLGLWGLKAGFFRGCGMERTLAEAALEYESPK